MSSQIDQKTYLQKYLSGKSGEKRKKKKKNFKGKGLTVINVDVDLSKMRPLEGDELDVFGEGEDAPQIAGIIDERPEEIKKLEHFKTSSKWRVITQDDGYNSKLKVEEIKKDIKEVQKENEIVFGKMYSDSEDEEKDNENSKSTDQNKNTNLNKSDSDASPPRKNHKKESRRYEDNDSDLSPPRKHSKDSKQSKNSKRHDNDSDVSPPRRNNRKNIARKNENDSDLSPPRKYSKDNRESKNSKGCDSGSDMGPPRRNDRKTVSGKDANNSDLSPPRKHDSKTKDKRRPRKESRWGYFESEEKVEVRIENFQDFPISKRRDSDESSRNRKETTQKSRKTRSPELDLSPPRKKSIQSDKEKYSKDYRNYKYRDSSKSDLRYSKELSKIPDSNEKSSRKYAKESPPKRRESPDDYQSKNKQRHFEKPHRHNDSDSDQSPPRKRVPERSQNRFNNDYRKNDREQESDSSQMINDKMTKTLDGKKAGLQDARQLRIENDEFKRREEEAFQRMNDEVSGRNAKAVARKSKRETSEDREKQRQKAERQKEIDAKYQRWGKGLKQLEDRESRYQDFLHEASKPLARHKGDTDLESTLKQVERDGDPMLEYMRQKKRDKGELGPEKPIYKGNFPPNRFNIRPGYRWDGVDRSNGYEKKFFEHQSKRKAQEEEAYKWSTEDL